MFNTQHRLARTTTAIASFSILTLCLATSPASARRDPGPTAGFEQSHRVLARVGTQYVVGDDLTGNGVPAPAWIREL